MDPVTLLFVHGTGVRGRKYSLLLREIQQQVEARSWQVSVRGCFWGDSQGARLQIGGKSIPGYGESGGGPAGPDDETTALWAVLYTDPWYELRLLRNMPVGSHPAFGEESPSEVLRRNVEDLVASDLLIGEFAQVGLDASFLSSLITLRQAPEFDQALATAPPDPLEHRRAIARALVAQTLVTAEEEQGALPLDGSTRDALVGRLTDELHGYGMGVGEFLLRPAKGLASRMITRKLTGDRGSITDAAAPMAGDVLRFLANGEGARSFLRETLTDLRAGSVILVGHSLGGIMCVDLLVRDVIPQVPVLVTVGSQAPFLYEIGALPCLAYPTPLPEHFPRWLNIYDRRDILSYVGGEVFGDRLTDLKVDNGEPFPRSHSAYWSNADVWDAIEQVLP